MTTKPRSSDFSERLRDWRPASSAIRAHLQRWLNDDRGEDVWKKVSKAAGANLGPEEFIRFVAHAAMKARALPVRIETWKREVEAAVAGQRDRVSDAFSSSGSLSEIADVLEDAAWDLRMRERFSMLHGYPSGAISRRQKGTQGRRALSLIMSDFCKERCGIWMDEEVGILLEIAFGPGSGDDSAEEVRGYRRSRNRGEIGGP